MMPATLDAIITGAVWLSSQALQVSFASHHTAKQHQLYLGRTLVGVTTSVTDRTINAHIVPTASPSPLQLVAVDPIDVRTNYGRLLPTRPYNKFLVQWTANNMAADTERFAVFVATEPGTEATVLHQCVEYHGNGNYQSETPAVDQSGYWSYSIQPIDDAQGADPITEGNYGEGISTEIRAKVYPPDVQLRADRSRFTTSVQGNVMTLGWEYGWGVQ